MSKPVSCASFRLESPLFNLVKLEPLKRPRDVSEEEAQKMFKGTALKPNFVSPEDPLQAKLMLSPKKGKSTTKGAVTSKGAFTNKNTLTTKSKSNGGAMSFS